MRVLFTFLLSCLTLLASAQSDSVVVSLITCGEGDAIHEYYGHTALRVRKVDSVQPFDCVFNYGAFDFNKPDFAWLFIKGETDYTVTMEPTLAFLEYYGAERHIQVDEQVLNLTQTEACKLAESLYQNAMAAIQTQWTYRYNFFYDNCVTHALDMLTAVFESEGATIVWPTPKARTLRQILHESAGKHPATMLGEDMLLGCEIDREATLRDQLFSPLYTFEYVKGAKVKRPDGSVKPLVQAPTNLLKDERPENHDVVIYYVIVAVIGLLLVALLVYEKAKKKYFWGIDLAVVSLQALIGTVIALMFFFSVHPAVDSNWLILWFNPLWFLDLAYLIFIIRRKHISKTYKHSTAVLTLACGLAFVFGPQSVPVEILAAMGLYIVHLEVN